MSAGTCLGKMDDSNDGWDRHSVLVGVSLEVVQASAEVQLPVPSAP